MPLKRRQSKARSHRITPEAVAAFKAGDEEALRVALDLPLWHASPLWTENVYPPTSAGGFTFKAAQELRMELGADE